ncbi:MAG: c-type cytochrome [Bacteroidota bacterium]
MNSAFRKYLFLTLVLSAFLFNACQQPKGNSPGSEYMPDMAHSIAYEANYYNYYYFNTWGSEDDYYKIAKPRKPVAGTIPRGYTKLHYAKNSAEQQQALAQIAGSTKNPGYSTFANSKVPYHYEDTEAERSRAAAEIIMNPFPITEDGLARGQELYDLFCAICHGEKGDGNGYLVAEENPNAAYPAAPANFLLDTFYNSTNGRYYHALIYGKNVMGGYADKMSYEERWQVIHWIHALQAKEKKLAYDESVNTLNNIDVPGSTVRPVLASQPLEEDHSGDGSHDEGGHGDGHGHSGGHGDGHSGDDGHGHDGGDHGHDDGHGEGHGH